MRDLLRQLGWYASGTVGAAAVSGLLLLVYARSLPPDQLGALVLAQATVGILRILGTLGAPGGMFRYVAGAPEDRVGRSVTALVTTTLAFVVALSSIVGAASLLGASLLLGNLEGHDPLRLMELVALTAVASAPREIVELVLRAEARARTWSVYTVVSSVLLAAGATIAVVAIAATAETILAVQLASLVVISGGGLALIGRSLGRGVLSPSDLRAILRLGVPNSAGIALDWILHYVDRYILLAFTPVSDVGVYSFGSRIGMLVQQVGGAAVQASWDPYSYRSHRGEGAAKRLGASSTVLLVAVLGQVVVLGVAAAPLVVAAGGRADYLAGAAFAFPIGLAYWLGTARYLFTTPVSLRFRPELALFALGAAAASSIALDLTLIPAHGIYGAAIAIVTSSLLGAVVAFVIGRRYKSIAFEPVKLSLAVAMAVVAFVLSSPISPPSAIATLLVRPAVATVVFVATIGLAGIIPSPGLLLRRVLHLPMPRVRTDWSDPLPALRRTWHVIPVGAATRYDSSKLLAMSDSDLLGTWERARVELTSGDQWDHRGWYHARYRDELRGRDVLDVGCGLAIDTLTFAQNGARVTLMDLHETNLEVVRRIARLLGVTATVLPIRDLGSFDALGRFDVVCALGSLHHAPATVIRPETAKLLEHLPVGGRWLQLAYPFSRWERDGRPPFDAWGQITDGPGIPWAEPYDLEKLLGMLAPATFDDVLCREMHGGDFIWFDLRRTG